MPPAHASDAPKPGRTRRNVTQACTNCRARKKKCDGARPCATCVFYKDECSSARDDWRKPLSKAEVNGLRARVAELEGQVEEYRLLLESRQQPLALQSLPLPPRPTSQTSGSIIAPCFAVDASIPQTPTQGPIARGSVDELVEDSRGILRVHNATSAFHHLAPKTAQPSSVARLTNETDPRRFARFLPDVYLTKAQHDTALDRFFRYFSPFGQRATPHLFYRDMDLALSLADLADLPAQAPNYSRVAHSTILALGLAYADEEHLRALSTRRAFHAHADALVDTEIASPCVATVLALTLRSSFCSTAGNYSLGWIASGLAIRLCFGLGLHDDTSALVARGKLTHESWVQRSVAFWSTYAQEEMWAIYIGRSSLMGGTYSCPPPVPDAVTDHTIWTWPAGAHEGRSPCASWLSTAFVHTVSLMRIATDITNTLYAGRCDKAALVADGTVERFRDTLDMWPANLPPQVSLEPTDTPALPHIILLNQSWAWVVILLFQPFSQIADAHSDFAKYAMNRCHEAAQRSYRFAEQYHRSHGLGYTPPTMAAIVYTTGATFLLAAAQAVLPSQVAASLERVRGCLGMLREIGCTWEAGHQKADILERLLDEFSRSADAGAAIAEVQSWPGVQGVAEPLALAPEAAFDASSWMADESLEQFIQTLFAQNTIPIGGEFDIMAMLQ